jgi:hypothetical protein
MSWFGSVLCLSPVPGGGASPTAGRLSASLAILRGLGDATWWPRVVLGGFAAQTGEFKIHDIGRWGVAGPLPGVLRGARV